MMRRAEPTVNDSERSNPTGRPKKGSFPVAASSRSHPSPGRESHSVLPNARLNAAIARSFRL
jgi:hypothetical protein